MSDVCQACGACCAAFRVSFYWAETDAHPHGTVPQALTIAVGPHHVAMRGSDIKPVRCTALSGTVGQHTGCSIYPQRSSTCRDFSAGTDHCNKARAMHGLPPVAAS